MPLVANRIVDSAKAKVLSSALASRTAKSASVSNRNPTDPSRNVPPDSSTGNVLFKSGLTGNLWMMQPSASGSLAGVPPGTQMPPCCWTIRAPAGDRRASSVVIGKASNPVGMTLYYSATAGAKTHVMFDVTGYFLNP